MAKKIKTDITEILFKLIENVEVTIEADDKLEKELDNYPTLEKYFETIEEYRKEYNLIHDDKQIFINNYSGGLYVFIFYNLTEKIKNEIESNIKLFTQKNQVQNYLLELKTELESILSNFYEQDGVWSEADYLKTVFYPTNFPEELKLWNYSHLLVGSLMIGLDKIYSFCKYTLIELQTWLNFKEKYVENIPEKFFEKIPGTVLALYYHYIILARKKTNFTSLSIKLKCTEKEAMIYQLEKDGQVFTPSFERHFRAINSHDDKNPQKTDAMLKVIKLLDNKKAIAFAYRDIDVWYKRNE